MRNLTLLLAAGLAAVSIGQAQQAPFERLSPDRLDVLAPSERVRGSPGDMAIRESACRSFPSAGIRRRVVDIAVQEWGFFGFSVLDLTRVDPQPREPRRSRRRSPSLGAEESARVAHSIAGYWAVTPDGGWILDRQNREWSGPGGVAARWRYPWSAAFISWVMCEGGLGGSGRFERAVAHHVYIDQAIRARDEAAPEAAYAAYDIGEAPVGPGDLLCTARRSAYRTIADRRNHIGDGVRTHCDVVVKVDEAGERIFAIGGNVRGSVRLKLLPAVREQGGDLRPRHQYVDRRTRTVFAHLKLRADPIEADALSNTPTLKALAEQDDAFRRLEQRLARASATRDGADWGGRQRSSLASSGMSLSAGEPGS